jgi:hypothetical protein
MKGLNQDSIIQRRRDTIQRLQHAREKLDNDARMRARYAENANEVANMAGQMTESMLNWADVEGARHLAQGGKLEDMPPFTIQIGPDGLRNITAMQIIDADKEELMATDKFIKADLDKVLPRIEPIELDREHPEFYKAYKEARKTKGHYHASRDTEKLIQDHIFDKWRNPDSEEFSNPKFIKYQNMLENMRKYHPHFHDDEVWQKWKLEQSGEKKNPDKWEHWDNPGWREMYRKEVAAAHLKRMGMKYKQEELREMQEMLARDWHPEKGTIFTKELRKADQMWRAHMARQNPGWLQTTLNVVHGFAQVADQVSGIFNTGLNAYQRFVRRGDEDEL